MFSLNTEQLHEEMKKSNISPPRYFQFLELWEKFTHRLKLRACNYSDIDYYVRKFSNQGTWDQYYRFCVRIQKIEPISVVMRKI